jgi:hypothetical protein
VNCEEGEGGREGLGSTFVSLCRPLIWDSRLGCDFVCFCRNDFISLLFY